MTTSPTLALRFGAIAFAVLWAGWMMLSSGSLDAVSMTILIVCAGLAGYAWYRVMRWSFRRIMLLPDGEQSERS
jgi:hypothetical protein